MKTLKVLIYGKAGKRVSKLIEYYSYFKSKRLIKVSYLILLYLERTYGLHIHPKSKLGENLKLPHPTSIVIGAGVEIGDNVTIFQNVTLGGGKIGDAEKVNYPTIGRGSVLYTGAVIIGKVKIGENCIIGANSVVNVDVPSGSIAVGVPCEIKKNKN